jgi:ABC-type antimicrobial peptide transport system permease subunit
MILSDAFGLLAAGLILGAIMLTMTARLVEGMLYGVSAFDPMRIATITAMLTLLAIIAALVPALRAAAIDPIQALRAE